MASTDSELSATFREKALFMKTWQPASTPSNRDRLELYALHKQAVSGDAPSTIASSASGPERAKYHSWRAKVGLDQSEAMRLYMQESDRQIRQYGRTTPQTPQQTPSNGEVNNTPNGTSSAHGNTPRGLAAIPLLCAAAAESRPAYLRRLMQTPYDNAWWRRQEALCGTPGNLDCWPETILLQMAKLVEHVSLKSVSNGTIMPSFLWPLHNCFLSMWMLVISVMTTFQMSWSIFQIVVWGARRTGLSLSHVWKDDMGVLVQCINNMCESHQATSCRVVGLTLLPITFVVFLLNTFVSNQTVASSLFAMSVVGTWWYFMLFLPWFAFCFVGLAFGSGMCFALIEAAGV